RAERHRAGIRRSVSRHELEQRRLAGAVDTHHAPALLAADQQIQAVVDLLATVALHDAVEFGHVLAGARRRTKIELQDFAALGRLELFDLLEFLDARLDLRGVAGARL